MAMLMESVQPLRPTQIGRERTEQLARWVAPQAANDLHLGEPLRVIADVTVSTGPFEDLAHEAQPGDPPRGARPHGGTLQRTGISGAPALTTRLPGGHLG